MTDETQNKPQPAVRARAWKALARVLFDGAVYGPGEEAGDEIEMSAKDAKPLVALGVLAAPDVKK